ncbi:MAG TPA: prolyl oligopeptidase family serine peptidase, partial [Saprospiraceae bacterium]|nr:prolyl oligopeptidase family serine peptidase [Saprospiraceae bacterium]
MKKILLSVFLLTLILQAYSQDLMSPELLWSLGRVQGESISPDGKQVYYTVTRYDQESNKANTQLYALNLDTRESRKISQAGQYAGNACFDPGGNLIYSNDGQVYHELLKKSIGTGGMEYSNLKPSPNGQWLAFSRAIKVNTPKGDQYPELTKSPALIYDDLMFRHWNSWEDGYSNHIFIGRMSPDGIEQEKDLLYKEPYDAPTVPFGDLEDFNWSPDSRLLAYVSVKKTGKAYAQSTNSDIYLYDLGSGKTKNVTEGLKGYDKNPVFSPDGKYLAWTSMARDGYEADKADLYVMDLQTGQRHRLTEKWDETIQQIVWDKLSKSLYCVVPYRGSLQLFEIGLPDPIHQVQQTRFRQITKTDFDYNQIIGQSGSALICQRTDFNHAVELFAVNIETGSAQALTQVNDAVYSKLRMSPYQKQWIKTTDGKQMLAWVIFPPDFDSSKKYPTLLYCQGGPQSALTQYYSFRWNFQLMAAKGYIIVAPNRRGMPGWGSAWNEQISGDWGGQCMKDYLSAIDQVSEKPYVDKSRRAAVGASFGGYSVFMLAGMHKDRFKTFISHCG